MGCGNFIYIVIVMKTAQLEKEMVKMGQKLLNFWQQPIVNFIGRTIIYFVILLILLYLYDYSGIGSPKFIYNEF
ncbi:teichoic acid D-Ala incorporation-associated protein DltX [Latilactobacillus fuchuensis]